MKKILATILITITMLMACSSCKVRKDKIKITIWHNYGGQMEVSITSLLDEFNQTIGEQEGIYISSTYTGSSNDLQNNLMASANKDPGSLPLPDIATGYPKNAIYYQTKDMLIDFNNYLTANDKNLYRNSFLEEGFFNNGLYVFPTAKSTEVLFLNKTLLSEGLPNENLDDMLTKMNSFEGLFEVAKMYYEATGKAFIAFDSFFNLFELTAQQTNTSFLANEQINDTEHTKEIFSLLMESVLDGGTIIYNGYSSDLSKDGRVACSLGSTAGILFYGDTITYGDNTVKDVEFSILPYPVHQNGNHIALQRGSGMMGFKSTPEKEKAVTTFLKWFTAPEQNLKFILTTGYLPVTNQAFAQLDTKIPTISITNVKKLLSTASTMYEKYDFYMMPLFDNFDTLSKAFEKQFKNVTTNGLNE